MTSTTAAWAETEHPRAETGIFTDKTQGAPEITLRAAEAPANGPEMTALLDAATSTWRETAAADEDTPQILLVALSLSDRATDRNVVASNRSLPMDALERLSKDEGDYVKEGVAGNPNATAEMLASFLPVDELDTYWEEDTLEAVARHSNTAPETLALLADDRFGSVQARVGANPHTDAAVLRELSRSDNEWVRHSLIQNQNTPAEILERYATDPSLTVKQRLVSRRGLPESVYLTLARDENPRLRAYIASEPSMPAVVKDLLKMDPVAEVSDIANRTRRS